MTTVQDVLQFIETIAPTYMKEHWDKVGLNCGRLDKPVKRILVALDPFQAVCEEAVRKGADLLVTHHALIWIALPAVLMTFSQIHWDWKTYR